MYWYPGKGMYTEMKFSKTVKTMNNIKADHTHDKQVYTVYRIGEPKLRGKIYTATKQGSR